MARLLRVLVRAGMAAVLLVALGAAGVQGAEGPPEDFRISGPGATGDEWEPVVAWETEPVPPEPGARNGSDRATWGRTLRCEVSPVQSPCVAGTGRAGGGICYCPAG